MKVFRSSGFLLCLCAFAPACHVSGGASPDADAADAISVDAGPPCEFDAAPIPAFDASGTDVQFPLGSSPAQVGNDGRLVFEYQSGDLGPLPFAPMLAGSHEVLEGLVTAGVLRGDLFGAVPPLSSTSSNQDALQPTSTSIDRQCCPSDGTSSCTTLPQRAGCSDCAGSIQSLVSVAVQAGGEGEATLTMRTDDGAEFESVSVPVRTAATLRPAQYTGGALLPTTSVTVPVGQTIRIRTAAFDASGTQLEARYGITYSSSNLSVCGVREPGFTLTPMYAASVDSFDAEVKGIASGSCTLTITANNATASVTVTVQ